MQIEKKFILGVCQTTCYLVKHNDETILIDAGENSEKVSAYLSESNLKLDKILITHAHFDHIAGLNHLTELYPECKVYIATEEMEYLRDPKMTLSTDFGSSFAYNGVVYSTDQLNVEGLEVRHIAGHSLNSSVYIFHKDQTVFTGDTLFKGSVGRSDFINGNQPKLLAQIKSELLSLDDEYKVYPGHGFASTILQEKETNMFFN